VVAELLVWNTVHIRVALKLVNEPTDQHLLLNIKNKEIKAVVKMSYLLSWNDVCYWIAASLEFVVLLSPK